MSMTVLYGIKHCDTVNKARRGLADRGVAHRFHDFRADGLDQDQRVRWAKQMGWETLLNRRGTAWRRLPAAQRDKITDAASASPLCLATRLSSSGRRWRTLRRLLSGPLRHPVK